MDELAKRLGSASIDTKSLVSVPVARMGSVSSGFSFARASPAGAGHSPALDFSAHQTSSKPAKDKRESDVYMYKTQNRIEKRSESPGTFATASPAASFSSTFSYTPSTTKTFALGSVGKSVSSKSSAKPVIGSKVKKSVLNRQVSAFASASASAVSDAKDFLKEQAIHEEDDLSDL